MHQSEEHIEHISVTITNYRVFTLRSSAPCLIWTEHILHRINTISLMAGCWIPARNGRPGSAITARSVLQVTVRQLTRSDPLAITVCVPQTPRDESARHGGGGTIKALGPAHPYAVRPATHIIVTTTTARQQPQPINQQSSAFDTGIAPGVRQLYLLIYTKTTNAHSTHGNCTHRM